MTRIKNITVLGTGNMGPGLAVLFATHGYLVRVWAHSPAGLGKARSDCDMIVTDLVHHRLLDASQCSALINRISVTDDLESAVGGADFICEAIIEDLEIKRAVYSQVQQLCPRHAIIASNTSTLLPSTLQTAAPDPGKILVSHFWNPAHLVPLVEICGGKQTEREAVDATEALLAGVGKKPVVMRKEILGFIGNRLMHAMYREALSLIEQGIIDAKGIDEVVLSSFGPRFANLGPLEYMDYIGLDLIRRVQVYLYGDLETRGGACPVIEKLTGEGRLGTKTGAGFYDWSEKDIDDVKTRRDAEMIRKLSNGSQRSTSKN